MKQVDIDEIYQNIPPDKIPWNIESPPDALVKLVASRKVQPCKAIDLGCGAGNYALYLAGLGFGVTGVDSSPTAKQMAVQNSERKGIRCRFVVADVTSDLGEINDTFDFAYDWELLHHIFPEDRVRYVKNVHRITNPGAKYLSVCFSDSDASFGGTGKCRETPLGTRLYFSSEDELRDLFQPYFNILDLRTMEIRGKSAPHMVNYAFMERSNS
jgi:SAM-dependent methyltransferase